MFTSHLSPKVVCISHLTDVDGCVCSSLIRYATRSSFILTNYGDIEKCLRNIGERYDLVYLCDLGIDKSILKEFGRIRRFAELIYIDHHPLDEELAEGLVKMGVTVVHNQSECASILTFSLFQGSLPREAGLLASYAAFSDRLENGPIAREIIQKYDRDFVLFENTILSYALKGADVEFKRKLVWHLSNFEYPHQIEGVAKLALKQADRMTILRKELPLKASKLHNIAYAEAERDSPGTIANLLLDVCEASIGIGYKTDKQEQISDLSIRGKPDLKIDLGNTTSKLAQMLGGFGGGHSKACGARIPASKLTEFIRDLSHKTI
jgi:hypothetical protein